MTSNFPLFLALKYLKPKRSVASVITIVSVLGVMLGVAVVIIVRSVMTGFGDIWEEKILDFKPHVSLVARAGNVVTGEEEIAAKLRKIEGVTCVTPEIDTRVLLSCKGKVLAPVLIGVDGDDFRSAYKLGSPYAGDFDLAGDSIVIGVHAARQLGCWVGDEITVYSPKTMIAKDEIFLPLKWKVTGIFSSGQYQYDSGYAVASLPNLRDLMGMEKGVFAIHLKTDCPTGPGFERVLADIDSVTSHRVASVHASAQPLRSITWREADREIFNALAVEKNMTALLLSLISLVAVFCVMNTLLVLTVQKTPEIGLLKALGFSKLQIMKVFMVHGLIQCCLGIVLGLLASWAVLSNLQRIVEWLASIGISVFPASVYGLAEIPHRVIVSDIFWVVALVFVFGFLASSIPAFLASLKDPVKALNRAAICCLVAAWVALPSFAGNGVAGLYQALYTGTSSLKTTGDPAADGEIVPGALFCSTNDAVTARKLTWIVGEKTYTMGVNMTAAYKGVMRMEAGRTYGFVKNFDDQGRILVIEPKTYKTNQVLLCQSWGSKTVKTYTPSVTGWHGIELRVQNASGGIGPTEEPFTAPLHAGMLWNDSGLTTCTKDNCDQWHRFMNDEKDGTYLFTDVPDPRYDQGGTLKVSGTSATLETIMTYGKATLTMVATDKDGIETTKALGWYEASDELLSFTMGGLTAGKSYTIGLRAVTQYDDISFVDFGSVYFGNVSVAKGVDALTRTMTPGTFVISRPTDADSTAFDLTVKFLLSGATPGTHYEAVSETATIPAGASSVEVSVMPIWTGSADRTLTLTLTPGLSYFVGTGTAVMTIVGTEKDPHTRYVSTDGSDANDGLAEDTAFLTLDRALQDIATLKTSTVNVLPGTYIPTNRVDNLGRWWSHYEITNNVTIIGTGKKPEDVHFRSTCTSANFSRLFLMNNENAKLKNLLISGGRIHSSNAYPSFNLLAGAGVCINSRGGTVEDCVISNNYITGWCNGGGGVRMWAGRILRTKFVRNLNGDSRGSYDRGSALHMDGGNVENCLFTNNGNGSSDNGYCAVELTGSSTLANCTIAGNHGEKCAGISAYDTKCRIYNCAIFNNDIISDATGHSGVYELQGGATVEQFINCAADRDIGSTCFTSTEGGFANQAAYDYHLAVSSVCRDQADESYYVEPYAISATDLDGIPRMTGSPRGKKLDIGCYEFDNTKLSVDFYADSTLGLLDYDEVLLPYKATFHAVKNGGKGTVTYMWDFDADGTIDLTTTDEDVEWEYPALGVYTVLLYASDESGDATARKDSYMTMGPKTVYVNCASATPVSPYLTRETAAKEVADAYPCTVDGTLVLVATGVYARASNSRLTIAKGITVWCEGETPADTVFTNQFGRWSNASFFNLSHADAFLANATFVDVQDRQTAGAGITLQAGGGTVSNCVFRNCGSDYNLGTTCKAGGAYVQGGLVTHCIFDNCYYYMPSGQLESSGLSGMRSGPNEIRAQGAYVTGSGALENCLFENMHSDGDIVCLQGSGATMKNCTVANCSVRFGTGNEISVNQPTPRYRYQSTAVRVYNDLGTVYNTAIVNVTREAYYYYSDPKQISTDPNVWQWVTNSCPATNCATWAVVTHPVNRGTDTKGHFQYCATEDAAPVNDTCFRLSRSDDFVDYANGDFTPEIDGTLYNSALKLAGWNKIVDLAGNARVIGRGMDIGCYEQTDGGAVITNIYVDCNYTGDESDGTLARPYLTIRDACTNEWAAGVGRVILVRGGPGRVYTFSTAADTAVLSGDEWQLVGCDADWNPATGYVDTNLLATIVVSNDYAAQSYTAASKKTTWDAPIEVQCADCRISGFKFEFGNVSFKQQDKGGTGLIHTIADGLTVENCHFKMTDDEGDYEGAGTMGVICSNTKSGTENFTLRKCYAWLGKYRGSVSVFGYFGDGTRAEHNLFENIDTLYCGSGNHAKYANYYVVSNIFLNCSGDGGDYDNELLADGGQYCPYGGEVAYNRVIHNDGKPGHYVFMSHGKPLGGSWVTAAIHHNTIVGYDCAFTCADQGYMWTPSIFDNIIVGTGTNLLENATDHWKEGREYNSSFKEGSMFMKNALNVGKFVDGTATEFSWYDLKNLSGTNTTHSLASVPSFVNTVNPQSDHYYRLKIPQCPWVIDAYTGVDPVVQEFPRYVGAVSPQPGGFAVRIR